MLKIELTVWTYQILLGKTDAKCMVHFIGHGGAKVAEYVKQNLFSHLLRHPKFISDTKVAIDDAYKSTDSEFLESDSSQNQCGSTASTAVLVGDRLFVANVGDSRAIICRGGNAIAVSKDHKPDQTDERQRIEDAGGFVMWAGTWRVGGVLAVSRAFGDKLLKQYVVVDPEIRVRNADPFNVCYVYLPLKMHM
ncbi:hypothetical protein E2562_004169 [Oryza meyeriana var. granulata]|uniref:protein-serine/threonine phosphatase n=1 Tax=Oryza meyeriana var. granulata TaxID=110450 RepID=A0A6G1BQK3_9ORYZ|nr:hypothetical protein E2562_004169 [Oryza meyeriana var. granulata]